MSVITVIHDPEEKATWVGGNDRATIGSLVGPSIDKKWLVLDDWLVGITGAGPKLEALLAAAGDFPRKAKRPHEILQFMRTAYGAFDIGETDEGLKRYSGSGFIVHKIGAVWDFDNSFCLTEVPRGAFWARGSGMDLAIGAASALKNHVARPEALTRRVLEIVIENDVDCPGAPLVQKFDSEGVLTDH
ncbi:MAG: hypothetical protein ACE5FO_08165 [Parvularculaceae bacterium]